MVIGGDYGIEKMFRDRNYHVIGELGIATPDLVCFTGGADVSPSFYGEKPIIQTQTDPLRDKREQFYFDKFFNIPKVGICRGGQFLNVLSGGEMWQHVNNHGSTHEATDLMQWYKRPIKVTSTHRQMMRAGPDGEVIAIANKSSVFLSDPGKPQIPAPKHDTEVVYYEKTKSLCFQPHPEYVSKDDDCNIYFFDLVNYLL